MKRITEDRYQKGEWLDWFKIQPDGHITYGYCSSLFTNSNKIMAEKVTQITITNHDNLNNSSCNKMSVYIH